MAYKFVIFNLCDNKYSNLMRMSMDINQIVFYFWFVNLTFEQFYRRITVVVHQEKKTECYMILTLR